MSFLTENFDLSHSICNAKELHDARAYLLSTIAKIDPNWIKDPKGVLAGYWNSNSVYNACYLIDLAFTLQFFEYHISKRSLSTFLPKVEGILWEESETTFLHNLTEFQVGVGLARCAGQFDVDPLVPEQFLLPLTNHRRPKSPDFAVQFPDGKVFIEVTTCHVEKLDNWDKSVDSILSPLKAHLREEQKHLGTAIRLPLSFRGDIGQINKRLRKRVDASPSGREIFSEGGEFQWKPVSFIEAPDIDSAFSAFFKSSDQMAMFSTPGDREKIRNVFTSDIDFASKSDRAEAENVLIKSLRNTLNYKRDQLREANPVIIALRFEHRWLSKEAMATLIQERIFPNPIYHWIAGIAVFTPRRDFSNEEAMGSLRLCVNPNAEYPIGDSFISRFGSK